MRYVMKSREEVAHFWVAQDPEQHDARYSHCEYRGNTIYSYGWWPMGVIMPDGMILIRNWSYSNSTSKDMSAVHGAIRNHEVIYCYDPTSFSASEINAIEKLQQSTHNFEKARKKTRHITANDQQYKQYVKLCEYFKKPINPEATKWVIRLNNPDVDALIKSEALMELARNTLIEQLNDEAKKRNQLLDEQEQVTQAQVDVEKEWCEGGSGSGKISRGDRWKVSGTKLVTFTPWINRYSHLNFTMTRLRIVGNKIETSQDAYVPVESGKRLWSLMKAKARLLGEKCGSYTVVNWNGNLKVGCHNIEKEEIKRFILFYGWDNKDVVFNTLGL